MSSSVDRTWAKRGVGDFDKGDTAPGAPAAPLPPPQGQLFSLGHTALLLFVLSEAILFAVTCREVYGGILNSTALNLKALLVERTYRITHYTTIRNVYYIS